MATAAPTAARLMLRPVRTSDAEAFFSFLGDPGAMRFTRCHTSLRECRRRLATFEWMRRRHGYAPWAIIGKADGQLVGWGGIYRDPFDTGWGPELGYSLHPQVWGQGFATELARVCVKWADDRLGLPETRAFVHPDNAASRRVLEKAGFSLDRFVPAMNRFLFSRPRDAPNSRTP